MKKFLAFCIMLLLTSVSLLGQQSQWFQSTHYMEIDSVGKISAIQWEKATWIEEATRFVLVQGNEPLTAPVLKFYKQPDVVYAPTLLYETWGKYSTLENRDFYYVHLSDPQLGESIPFIIMIHRSADKKDVISLSLLFAIEHEGERLVRLLEYNR